MEIIIGLLIIAAFFTVPGMLGYWDQEARKKLEFSDKKRARKNKKKKLN